MDSRDLPQRLSDAIVSRDLGGVRACFTPDAQIWHGYDCVAQDISDFLATIEKMFATGLEVRYEDIRTQTTPTGFVSQYLVVVPGEAGGWTAKPCCTVYYTRAGLIHRVQEYLDRTGTVAAQALPISTPGI